VRAAFCSADSVRDLAEGAVQPHAAELCFIYRVYEEPGVLIGRAPRGETRAFRCAQGAIKAVFGYILDGSDVPKRRPSSKGLSVDKDARERPDRLGLPCSIPKTGDLKR